MDELNKSARWIITVTGSDRPGLVAAISSVLAEQGADIEDVTMTRLSGNFATILLARGGVLQDLDQKLQNVGKRLNLNIHTEPAFEVAEEPEPNYYISAVGPNRVGIVAAISGILAKHQVNITEMSTRLLSRTEVPVYMVRIEAITARDTKALEDDLLRAAQQTGVELRCEPLERTDM
jgi:glycine cleavage system transcriptional repressor